MLNSEGFNSLLKMALVGLCLLLWPYPSSFADRNPPFLLPAPNDVRKLKSAIIQVKDCQMRFELFPEDAPWHVANFKYLADKNFYQGLRFHFYDPGYILQGGDPKGNGMGTIGYDLPAEFSRRHHTFGTLGMGRKPDILLDGGAPANAARVSSGSQFHILLGDARHMDEKYTIFGQLTNGSECLKSIRQGDLIEKVTVYVRP